MAVYDSPGYHSGAATVLSPQQFYAGLEGTLRAAIAAGSRRGREEALSQLSGFLCEVPNLGPARPQPPSLPLMLVDGVRFMLQGRHVDAADSERLLADLMEFVLAFYPEAVPPPFSWEGD